MTTTIFKRRLVPLLLAACFGAAVAAPTGQQVVAGQATFSQQGNVFSITNTPGTIINWQSFSINPGEVTRFIQQGSDSAVLNRITGQDPSRILGALQSNGKVFLINPNGILFGRDSRVDVNGLVASSLNISNADFLAGKKNFQAGAVAGEVRNEGAITTPSGGQVFLVAPNVSNAGIITSPKGDVVLAAGHSVQLVDSRDPDLQVVVSAPADQAINLGQVVAQGGRIGIYGALVNQRGLVSANSAVVGENGKIVLKASRSAQLEAGSVTSATGAGTGGAVHVLGDSVGLTGDAAVDASGRAGGGTVLVGGDWQGKNAALPNAKQTVMGKDASIKADALVSGDGGKVVLWSDASTTAQGSISAQGGANGGNGGKIETSGHNLNVDGIKVRAGAAKGKNGDWLLDPYDIEVVTAGANTSAADAADKDKVPGTGVSKVAPSTLLAAGTNVQLAALHDITVTDAINAVGNVTASAGNDLKINADITSASGNVVLLASNSINLAATASLKSNNYVDLIANQMTLAGNIGPVGSGQKPIISFNPGTDARVIQVGGSNANDALWLDPAALGRFSAFGVNLGSSAHTGGIVVNGALSLAGNLSMDTAGAININAPITAGSGSSVVATLHSEDSLLLNVGSAITAGKLVQLKGDGLRISAPVTAQSVVLAPNNATTATLLGALDEHSMSLDQAMLKQVNATSLTIGGQPGQVGSTTIGGAIDLGTPTFGKLIIDAGSAAVNVNAPFAMNSGALVLKGGDLRETINASLKVDQLAFTADTVALNTETNRISTIAGSAKQYAQVTSTGDLRIGQVDGQSGLSAVSGGVSVTTTGLLTLDADVNTTADRVLLYANGITGNGTVSANSLQLQSTNGVGSDTAAINVKAKSLSVYNDQNGSKPINVSNTGSELSVYELRQNAATSSGTNGGAITLHTSGNLTVERYPVAEPNTRGISAGTGNINLGSGGSMTVNGKLMSDSGNISLASGGDMVVGGAVTTNSGNLGFTTGASSKFTVSEGARVASTSGSIDVSAGSTAIATGAITAADGKLHVTTSTPSTPSNPPPPATPPTVDVCAATPTATGCDVILQKARDACSADWNAGHCDQVMPTEAVAAHNALLACIANPKGPNCGSVLPQVDSCQSKPGQPGCEVVLAERAKIDACLANPSASCFSSTLPSAAACSAKPDTYGCSAVQAHQTGVLACLANPTSANCASVVLPTLAVCQADASVDGCSATLARQKFLTCSTDATLPGCASVLPAVSVCKLTPTAEGCGAVIKQTFDKCLASPNDAVCVGILPTVSQCVLDKTAAGCQAVLPTMNQCIGSPTLQGCGVVLPKLEQCAANPNLQGCEAVLPKPDFCSTHPLDPTCRVFDPQPSGSGGDAKTPVTQTVQTTVTLINSSTGKPASGSTGGTSSGGGSAPGGSSTSTNSSSSSSSSSDSSSDKQSGPAASENSGAKNEKPATKTYCN